MPALLIAGPLALEDFPGFPGLLGGSGGYAAMAAGPLNPIQLWACGPVAMTAPVRGILERRGIDLAGVEWTALPTVLPEIEPTDAEDVGAVLLIDLPPAEMTRALAVVQRLPESATRPVLVRPRAGDLTDAAYRRLIGTTSDVLLLAEGHARTVTKTSDTLAAAEALHADGWKSIALSAGQLGGVLLHGSKATTWPALPIPVTEPTGIGAAFAGAVAAWVAGVGSADYATLKRACAVASGVGGLTAQGIGPKRLLAANHDEILERFNRLRREHKY